jgi:transglutaminase-like putative cysteine protease
MIYAVRHRTTYTYGAPVSFARCVLRLTPRSSPTQTVLDSHIAVSPEPARLASRVGPFGEVMTTATIETAHRRLIIEARSRVDVNILDGRLEFDAAWESVRTRSLGGGDLGPDGPASFIYPSARAPRIAEITDYARSSFTAGRGVLEAAGELMARIKADFHYDAEATDVSTSPAEAFAARRGVCQDFAHIMICGLRGLGLPARYVSGYLRTIPPPGHPRLEGADATHAWVSLWCGEERGWVGLDPTNGVPALDEHIVLAVGRDYADVAPIDGIILSPGRQSLEVEVDVVPEADVALLRPKVQRLV